METLERRRLLASPAIDVAFGAGGITRVPEIWGKVHALNQLDNGKIVLAAEGSALTAANPGLSWDPVIARFNPDGTLDDTFDGDGVLPLPQDDGVVTTVDAAVATDGKIYVLHNRRSETDSLFAELRVFRFNADGTVDTGFGGGDGIAVHSLPSGMRAQRITVQADAQILIAYARQLPVSQRGEIRLARLRSDGSLDTGFRGGISESAPSTGFGGVEQLLIGPGGQIYFSGSVRRDGLNVAVIARFNTLDGSPDTGFGGGDGLAELASPIDASPYSKRLAFDSAGRIVIASQGNAAAHQTLLVTRLTSTGARDTTFGGGDGEIDFGDQFNTPVPHDILIDPNDKPVIVMQGNDSPLLLLRLTSSGAVDTTYGNGGFFDPGRETFELSEMIFDNAGQLLIAGTTTNDFGYDELAITRVVSSSADVFLDPADGTLYVNGTAGNDTISFSRSGDQIVLTRNDVNATFAASLVRLIAAFGNDGDDAITIPFAFNSSLNGGHGNDTVTVGDGDVIFYGERGGDRIAAGDGDHVIHTRSGSDLITTGAGNDVIDAGTDADTIVTGNGDDSVDAGRGINDDAVSCGNGNDTIYVGSGVDAVDAGGGNDLIASDPFDVGRARGSGKKAFWGEDGNDTLVGGQAADFLDGGAGNDSILGGNSVDEIVGGAGDDVVFGDESGYHGHPTGGADYILAGDGNDWVDGENSDDTIFGGSGDDRLFGSDGADSVWGDGGVDKIYGGDGTDSIYGNGGNDSLYGNAHGDHMRGNDGRDRMYGHGGSDRLYGGANGDWIYGQPDSDQIFGEGGNDRLYGDDGFADSLYGGAGDDVFITLDSIIDHLSGDGGRDTSIADEDDILTSIAAVI